MESKKKQALIYILILVVCLIVPTPRNMEQSYTCQVFDQNDESYQATATVTFSGKYMDYLIRKDTFTGTVTVAGVDFLSSSPISCELTVYKNSESLVCALASEEYTSSIRFFGTERMNSFILDVAEGDGRYFITNKNYSLADMLSITTAE